ncbi:MAG: hypothetical protein AAFO68_04510 [Pseudomonadota bacterium]
MTRGKVIAAICSLLPLIGAPLPSFADGGPIAQILCAPSEDMRHRLETTYQAQRAWAGLRGPEEVMELWEDAQGDWTLVIARASGSLCIVAMGEALSPFADWPQS